MGAGRVWPGQHAEVHDAVLITVDDLDDGCAVPPPAMTNAPGTMREGSVASLANVHGRPVSSIVVHVDVAGVGHRRDRRSGADAVDQIAVLVD